jgi:hypothetical protein
MATQIKLNMVMSQYKVKGVDLAIALGCGTDTISRIRNCHQMCSLSMVDKLATAISKIAGVNLRGIDLLEDSEPIKKHPETTKVSGC